MFAEIYLWIWKYDTFFPHCSCNCPYWRRKWQPILVFLPGEFQGQRSLMGCCPWNRKELDTTEQLPFPLSHTLTCDSVSGHQYLHEDTAIVWVHPNTSCCYWPARLFIPLVKWSHSVMYNLLWPHGLQSPWNSPGQNTGVGSYSLLQGIFPTQGSNPGLPHCRQILYHLSHQGSIYSLKVTHF